MIVLIAPLTCQTSFTTDRTHRADRRECGESTAVRTARYFQPSRPEPTRRPPARTSDVDARCTEGGSPYGVLRSGGGEAGAFMRRVAAAHTGEFTFIKART